MPTNFRINGRSVSVGEETDTPLLWVIRDEIGLKGTKFGCGIGMCGACTVHVGGRPTRSCITPIDSIGTSAITTIEAIGATAAGARIQKAWLDREVVQCGYCQSGQIMQAVSLINDFPSPTDEDIEKGVTNLCRCGTYGRVRKAIHSLGGQKVDGAPKAVQAPNGQTLA